jgi:HTH-type transcriptional regulator / antitoxin HipB
MDSKEIGDIVKKHRKAAGISQIKLAEIAGVGKTVIYDIEKGKETVQLLTLLKVFAALNIKIKLESPLMNQIK